MAKSNDDRKSRLASSFFQVTREEPTGVRRVLSLLLFVRLIEQDDEYVCAEDSDSLFGILLYGEGFQKLVHCDGPPTLVVDGRPLVLPEPDGMLYVLGPLLRFQRVEVRAEKLEQYLDEGLMDEFYRTADWTEKLQPVLLAQAWSNKGLNGTPKAQP
jgi:hypothetical protein